MFDFDDVRRENIKEHNPNWSQIPDHPYKVLIIWGSGSGITNALLNLINHQSDTDLLIMLIYLYANHPSEAKWQLLINRYGRIS